MAIVEWGRLRQKNYHNFIWYCINSIQFCSIKLNFILSGGYKSNLQTGCPWDIVGNQAKRRISKQVLQKNKARQIFEKRTFLTPWRLTYLRIKGKEIFVFQKIWHALFSCNTRFEIHPFALLPTVYTLKLLLLLN